MVQQENEDFVSRFFTRIFGGNQDVKLHHDTYRVYVNHDFVGQKILLSESEQISDIDGYLHGRGFKEFDAQQNGDRYLIAIDDKNEEKRMKENLHVYLRIR